jgi:hypothetical protein
MSLRKASFDALLHHRPVTLLALPELLLGALVFHQWLYVTVGGIAGGPVRAGKTMTGSRLFHRPPIPYELGKSSKMAAFMVSGATLPSLGDESRNTKKRELRFRVLLKESESELSLAEVSGAEVTRATSSTKLP